MKFIRVLPILICAFGSHTFAYPNIGDRVQWTGTIVLSDGSKTPVSISKKVVGYSDKTKNWTVQYETQVGEHTSSNTKEELSLYNPEQYRHLLKNCTNQGGLIETLATRVGTYKTCRITTTTPEGIVEEKWWGDIPFGIVSKSTKEFNAKAIVPSLNSPLIEL